MPYRHEKKEYHLGNDFFCTDFHLQVIFIPRYYFVRITHPPINNVETQYIASPQEDTPTNTE